MEKELIARALRNGLTEDEAKWYLLSLESNINSRDAESIAVSIFNDEITASESGEDNAFTKFKKKKQRIPEKAVALIAALRKAKEAALRYKDVEDGGTCNFDTPTIRLERWQEKTVKIICKIAGLDCSKWENYYMNYHILGGCYGQANRRTDMAEAFAKSLENDGYKASVWYAID